MSHSFYQFMRFHAQWWAEHASRIGRCVAGDMGHSCNSNGIDILEEELGKFKSASGKSAVKKQAEAMIEKL